MALPVELSGLSAKQRSQTQPPQESALLALRPTRDQSRPDQLAERKAAESDVLLREIDEAVRQDELSDLLRRYGKPALGVVLGGLALFGGYLLWEARRDAALEQKSEEMVRALDHLAAGNTQEGTKALDPLAKDAAPGMEASALLVKAGIAQQKGDTAGAVKLYAEVAGNEDAPKPYRDLASVRLVSANFDAMKPEDVIARLKPLAVPGNPWFGSAGELVGIAYLKQGKTELAGPLFAAIAKSKDVPESLRARTRQMAGLLGVDAVEEADVVLAGGAGAGATDNKQ